MKLRNAPLPLALTALAALASAVLPGIADAKLATTGAIESVFTAVGPLGMKINGRSSEGRVDDDGTTVRVTVPLATVKTGLALRDKHMRENYLEVEKFPEAQLEVSRATVPVPKPGAEASGAVPAVLRLHGASKPVSVAYKAKRDGDTLHVQGTFRINLNDFQIKTPSYAGATVKPDVDVDVKFDAVDR